MARAAHPTQPLQALREMTVLLGASIRDCLANPSKTAVHQLRTSTRRIDAQFALLSMLPGLPPHQQEKLKALHLLKSLRRRAGRVRDIDVQRDLIRAEAATPDAALHKEARRLRRTLKRQRDDLAAHLLRLLDKQQTHVVLAFDELLDALASAESISLTEAQLNTLICDWYSQQNGNTVPRNIAELHAIRKRAKLARYLAESAPASATAAHRLAESFETIQEAGGRWHDWLVLAEIAGQELGASAMLPQRFAAHSEAALREFKRRLAQTAPQTKPAA